MFTYIYRTWRRKYGVSRRVLKITILMMFVLWSLIWIIIYCTNYQIDLTRFLGIKFESIYLVNNTKCQIMNLNPYSEVAMKFSHLENYENCTEQPLLTYVTNIDNDATLHVDNEAILSYSGRGVVCCYSNITRKQPIEESDNTIMMTECKMFDISIPLYYDSIYVRCFAREDTDIIYENTHATYFINEEVRKKLKKPDLKKQISVLLVGIDSVSRLNFIRALPNTHKYVESNGWVPLKAYNKVNDHSFPNLIALLTGRNSDDINEVCNLEELDTFDQCPLIWNDYRDFGYITSYAEDESGLSTFSYKKSGFSSPPTDYYFRPYILGSEKLTTRKRQGMTYCTGPETSGERIMNLAKDFGVTFKDYPHFGLFWMNTFSRNQLNAVSGMDNRIKDFLETLSKEKVLDRSVVIFFSNHGVKYDGIRLTKTGWLEEKLPFMYVSFPPWFKKTFSTEYNNFVRNSARLTSPYDLHMTLQHFLVLSGHHYVVTPSPGCPWCKSLLEEIDEERSCEEAGIEQHWCSCSEYTHVDLDKDVQKAITDYVLKEIYKIIASHDEGWKCARYFVDNITTMSIAKKLSYTTDTYLLVRFETMPRAIFEATINFDGDVSDLDFSISGAISRLDRYLSSGSCVTNPELKKYCYCLE